MAPVRDNWRRNRWAGGGPLGECGKAYPETGKKCVYLPNVTDRQDRLFEKAHRAVDMGVEALMLNVHATGYGTLGALAEDDSINVPLLAHPCYSGASLMGPDSGMASHVTLGRFMRLEGAEIVVYNSSYGKILSPDPPTRLVEGEWSGWRWWSPG